MSRHMSRAHVPWARVVRARGAARCGATAVQQRAARKSQRVAGSECHCAVGGSALTRHRRGGRGVASDHRQVAIPRTPRPRPRTSPRLSPLAAPQRAAPRAAARRWPVVRHYRRVGAGALRLGPALRPATEEESVDERVASVALGRRHGAMAIQRALGSEGILSGARQNQCALRPRTGRNGQVRWSSRRGRRRRTRTRGTSALGGANASNSSSSGRYAARLRSRIWLRYGSAW